MSQELNKTKHICLECALKVDYVVDTPCRISKNKCQVCEKSKEGLTLKNYKVRNDK